ncbi:sigma-70 family RNA polymerase sigma factor [Planctomycetota bacterium]
MNEVTLILNALEKGDSKAVDKLLPAVYTELHRLAVQKLANERPGHTLQATALVHEAYLQLVASSDQDWQGRRYFFGAAAEAMRRILIENARRKQSLKRGGQRQKVDLACQELAIEPPSEDLLALNEALIELEKTDKVKSDLVKLRYFAGLSVEQAAQALDISLSTAKRHWNFIKVWLYRKIRYDA